MRLREFQQEMRRFIADGQQGRLGEALGGEAQEIAGRLAIFRNNFQVTHTSALAGVFPVIRQLVGAEFFGFAAHSFFRDFPPSHPCLSECGARFPEFLAGFGPARDLEYLCDVGRLEWSIWRVCLSAHRPHIPLSVLASIGADPAEVRMVLDPAVRYLSSEYPIDIIWTWHCAESTRAVFLLERHGTYLEVRGGDRELLRCLSGSEWRFRASLAGGATLGSATEAAQLYDERFNLANALAALFSENLIAEVRGPETQC